MTIEENQERASYHQVTITFIYYLANYAGKVTGQILFDQLDRISPGCIDYHYTDRDTKINIPRDINLLQRYAETNPEFYYIMIKQVPKLLEKLQEPGVLENLKQQLQSALLHQNDGASSSSSSPKTLAIAR